MLNNMIRVSDHLPMPTLMARLPTLLLPGRALLRALLTGLARVSRWRQAAVLRAATEQPLELLDLRL
jgi:hypothetical protein